MFLDTFDLGVPPRLTTSCNTEISVTALGSGYPLYLPTRREDAAAIPHATPVFITHFRWLLTIWMFLGTITLVTAQEDAWVYFTDKPEAATYFNEPTLMLSQRSLDRRTQQNILLDIHDVPLHTPYRQAIETTPGITVLAQSKWFNCLHIRGTQTDIEALTALSFVSHVVFANHSLNNQQGRGVATTQHAQKNLETQTTFAYGNATNQIEMLNGHLLHQEGFTGAGKIIAVLDNGFTGVNTSAGFQRMQSNNLILGGYNFVERSNNFYSSGTHGTLVLSTMGGFVENTFAGTAPDAFYYLFVTEANAFENPLEESLWVEAAELADQLGADIINTSLGYNTFDNPAYNYTYADMNGQTAFITRGAERAFTRGMLCVTSAGNAGNGSWQYITAPADAANTLTVGAVNSTGVPASFTSIGPTPDGRIKPDVAAQGVGSAVITAAGTVSGANGTSFSSPITAGLVACFWQAFPELTNLEVLNAVRSSAHIFENPTAQMGYGIPNFWQAYLTQQALSAGPEITPEAVSFAWAPNPFDGQLVGRFPTHFHGNDMILYNPLGRIVWRGTITETVSIPTQDWASGLYLYQIMTVDGVLGGKVVRR
jgi:serine protease AprX